LLLGSFIGSIHPSLLPIMIMEIQKIKKLLLDLLPLGNYRDDEPVVSRRDIQKLIDRLDL